jgi:hypothetical protein
MLDRLVPGGRGRIGDMRIVVLEDRTIGHVQQKVKDHPLDVELRGRKRSPRHDYL